LVEQARTNLLLNSETLATQSVTVTAAAHTLSFYGTGTVTLSGTHSATVVGTGAFPTRTTLTFTPTSGSLTVTVSGTVQYGQVELGALATSWISTAGATATRNADVAQITGTNFSRWYSQSAGTVFGEVTSSNVSSGRILQFGDGTNNNRQDLLFVSGALNAFVNSGGSPQVNATTANTTTQNTLAKFGYAYKTDDFAWLLNAGISITDTSGTVPTVDRMGVGARTDSAAFLNGHIRRLAYFDRRLPNATLQAITA
jgi:hypothetical protein